MNKSFILLLVAIALCFVGCKYPLEPTNTSMEDANSLPVYYLGSQTRAAELQETLKVEWISMEKLSSLDTSKYLLIVDEESLVSDDILKAIALSGNPVILLGGSRQLPEMDIGAPEMGIPNYGYGTINSENAVIPTVCSCFKAANGTTYAFTSDAPMEEYRATIKNAIQWAISSIIKSKQEPASSSKATESWHTYYTRNSTIDMHIPSGAFAGRVNIRSKWSQKMNDGSSKYDYWVFQGEVQMVPGDVLENNSFGNEMVTILINAKKKYSDNYLDDYEPTSSVGSRSVSVGFGISGGIGIGATGPEGSLGGTFSKQWTYDQPDVVCSDKSDYSTGIAKWVYSIHWDQNPGQNTFKVKPGCIIRVKQGRWLTGISELYSWKFARHGEGMAHNYWGWDPM